MFSISDASVILTGPNFVLIESSCLPCDMSHPLVEIDGQDEGPEEPWERDFLREFLTETYGTVAKAAKAAGVTTDTVRRRERESLRFRQNLATSREILRDTVRYEVLRRALEPSERPVFHQGRQVGVIQEWDTKHLEWVAERLLPEEFHLPTRIESAAHDGDIKFTLELNPGKAEEPPEE